MIYLNRIINDSFFTRGVLVDGKRPLCHTLELPWNQNSSNISCIPEGVYDVSRSTSVNFGNCFRFASVRGRSGILIHAGNSIKDTRGCILVGLDANDYNVLHSKLAMDRLLISLPDEFKLTIRSIK